jgi:hypothetical protein
MRCINTHSERCIDASISLVARAIIDKPVEGGLYAVDQRLQLLALRLKCGAALKCREIVGSIEPGDDDHTRFVFGSIQTRGEEARDVTEARPALQLSSDEVIDTSGFRREYADVN